MKSVHTTPTLFYIRECRSGGLVGADIGGGAFESDRVWTLRVDGALWAVGVGQWPWTLQWTSGRVLISRRINLLGSGIGSVYPIIEGQPRNIRNA